MIGPPTNFPTTLNSPPHQGCSCWMVKQKSPIPAPVSWHLGGGSFPCDPHYCSAGNWMVVISAQATLVLQPGCQATGLSNPPHQVAQYWAEPTFLIPAQLFVQHLGTLPHRRDKPDRARIPSPDNELPALESTQQHRAEQAPSTPTGRTDGKFYPLCLTCNLGSELWTPLVANLLRFSPAHAVGINSCFQ